SKLRFWLMTSKGLSVVIARTPQTLRARHCPPARSRAATGNELICPTPEGGSPKRNTVSHPYHAPLTWMRLAMDQAMRVAGASQLENYAELPEELTGQILENASRFAAEVLSPLNPIGDRSGTRVEASGVVTAPGFPDAYRRFREDGWVSLGAPVEYGG